MSKREYPSGCPCHRMIVRIQKHDDDSTIYLAHSEDHSFAAEIAVGSCPALDEVMALRSWAHMGASLVDLGGRKILAINPLDLIEGLDW